jgi:thymidine kinase
MTSIHLFPKSIEPKMGGIHLITGPMDSGKSRYLITLYHELKKRGERVFVLSFDGDTRADDLTWSLPRKTDEIYITTRDINMAPILARRTRSLDDHLKTHILETKSTYLLIDEFQFLDTEPDIILELAQLMTVYISCLNGDYKQRSWKRVSELIPFCSSSETLKGKCHHCKKDNTSIFTIRNTESQEQVIIGGSDIYSSICSSCFIDWKKIKRSPLA